MEMNHSIHLNSRVGWDRNTDILLYNHPISKFKEFELDKKYKHFSILYDIDFDYYNDNKINTFVQLLYKMFCLDFKTTLIIHDGVLCIDNNEFDCSLMFELNGNDFLNKTQIVRIFIYYNNPNDFNFIYNVFDNIYNNNNNKNDNEYIDCRYTYFYRNEGRILEKSIRKNIYRLNSYKQYIHIFNNIKDNIINFLNSNSSILLLMGDPGTGKTTLIKEILYNFGRIRGIHGVRLGANVNAILTYSEEVFTSDEFFMNIIEEDLDFLILEDMDNHLISRENGHNDVMSKLLNLSDGLLGVNTKIIITTNLTSESKIDSALLRKGRCYDVWKFRNLNQTEASEFLYELDPTKELPLNKTSFNLGDIYSLI